MLRFSRNEPNQRYYLNGMWTCGPPAMIVNFLSSIIIIIIIIIIISSLFNVDVS